MYRARVAGISIVRSNQVRVYKSHDVKNVINSHCTALRDPKIAIARVDQAENQADGDDRSRMTTTVDRRWKNLTLSGLQLGLSP